MCLTGDANARTTAMAVLPMANASRAPRSPMISTRAPALRTPSGTTSFGPAYIAAKTRPRSGAGVCFDPTGDHDDQRGSSEGGGVEPEQARRSEQGDEKAGEWCAEQVRAVLGGGQGRRHLLGAQLGACGHLGKHRLAGGGRRRVEQRPQKGQHEQVPELEHAHAVEKWDARDADRTEQIAQHARPTGTDSIGDRAAEEGTEREGRAGEERRHAGLQGTARLYEDEPRNRDGCQDVAEHRDRIGEEDGAELRTRREHAYSGEPCRWPVQPWKLPTRLPAMLDNALSCFPGQRH